MRQISLKLEDELYQSLQLRSEIKNQSISDTFRECLEVGLKGYKAEVASLDAATKFHTSLSKKIFANSLFTYCLLEEFIKTNAENGIHICDKAESRAEKLTMSLIQKVFNEEKKAS